jgi:hypothetical protein
MPSTEASGLRELEQSEMLLHALTGNCRFTRAVGSDERQLLQCVCGNTKEPEAGRELNEWWFQRLRDRQLSEAA